MKTQASPVKQLALQQGLPLHQPSTLRDESALIPLKAAKADLLIVAAYGLLLPRAALEAARLGAVNIHASLLPRWRGAAPIQRAILAGDEVTGICIMQMDEGLDTGAIWTRHPEPIRPDDDAGTLHDRLAARGAEAIVAALPLIAAGKPPPEPQPAAGVTYAHKITRADQVLDWRKRNIELERAIRALRPAPGARSLLRGELVKLWAARCVEGDGAPGTVLCAARDEIIVACGEGALALESLQRAGGGRLSAAEFQRGKPLTQGEQFGASG